MASKTYIFSIDALIVGRMSEHADSIIGQLQSKIWGTSQQRPSNKQGNINRPQNHKTLQSPRRTHTASNTGEADEQLVSRTQTVDPSDEVVR